MKKSEAENYIKEIIISELSQVASPEDIANQSALNKELEKVKEIIRKWWRNIISSI